MNASPRTRKFGFLRSIGPAIIVASVVLGPGSILSASKTGQQFGYTMVWTLAVAVMLMMGMTALGSRLAVFLDDTLCEELAKRGGRPVAALAGVTIFLIAACFQFGNNLGILAAIEPFYGNAPQDETSKTVLLGVIVALNLVVIVAIFGLTGLYQRIERLMKILVGLMMIGFAGNLLLARPDVIETLRGLVPGVPDGAFETLLPRWQEATGERAGHIVDKLLPVTALFATTFVVGGAFFQAYLVRQKGWTSEDLRQGLVDSCVGIFALGVMTLMIMLTAASVLHDNE
ncbi:MAG: Nramp family divalent metal transporter, partial [Planctomycetes bacterium]|nr:Nramp family divalent metal transporter [Planctomycetota bacterium]